VHRIRSYCTDMKFILSHIVEISPRDISPVERSVKVEVERSRSICTPSEGPC